MEKIIKYLYYLLLFSFILPGGAILGIPIKILLSIILLVCMVIEKPKIVIDKYSIWILGLFSLITIWAIPAYVNGYTTSLSFIKNYLSLLFIVWSSYELIKQKIVESEKIKKIIYYISLTIVATKLILELALMANLFDINCLVAFYRNILNCDLTTMYFPVGNVFVYRLMVSNDVIPFVYFSFYLLYKNKWWKKLLSIIIMAFFTFIIYSRVIIIQYALIIMIYLMILTIKYNFFKRENYLTIIIGSIIIVGLICLLALMADTSVIENIKNRFFGHATNVSDDLRNDQKIQFINGIKENLLFGHGTGAYMKEYVRSHSLLYSYELEYLSFIYQFGIIGFLLIIGGTIFMFYRLCFDKNVNWKIKSMVLFNFLLWIAKPIFNPNFLSSNSGMIIMIIMLCSSGGENKLRKLSNMS